MRIVCLVLIKCAAVIGAFASETTTITRAATADELNRAIELERRGEVKEAERVVLNVIRGLERRGSSVELASALNNLAVLYAATDRYLDAERYFKRSIRMLEEMGGEPATVARAKIHLAALYFEGGRVKDAAKLNVPAILTVLPTPEDQVRARGVLASLAAARKDLATAERMLLEVLAFWTEPGRAAVSGIEIATTLNNLGVVALWQSRSDLARTRLQESFEHWQRVAGPKSPHMAKAMANVATAYMQLKDYDEAATWFARSAGAGREAFGETHPFIVAVEFARADALKKGGRKAEAREVARAASEARKIMRNPSTAAYTVDYRDVIRLGIR